MQITNSISTLYQVDNRTGDILLLPQRWCHHQWSKLTSPLDHNKCRIWQVANRIGGIILMIFPTLISYTIGFVGIGIKAFSPLSLPLNPSFLETIDPPSEEDLNPIQVQSPLTNRCVFKVDFIGKDIFVYIATFIRPREHLKLMEVSKEFHQTLSSPILWSKYLDHEEYRIWGATRWAFKYIPSEGYSFKAEGENGLENPLEQLKVYHELRKAGEAGKENPFFDYLARLMPGGPIAFRNIPRLQPIDASHLQPSDMQASVICGKDQSNSCFFAMLLTDHTSKNLPPIVLVFKHPPAKFIDDNQWIQEANSWWSKDQLRIRDTSDLNYILALIRRENLAEKSDFSNPKFKKTIGLANLSV